jgi:DNA-directed RNA polymerase specialized sigma24 family protein
MQLVSQSRSALAGEFVLVKDRVTEFVFTLLGDSLNAEDVER